MTITPQAPDHRQRLSEWIAREVNAKQRDRYRVVLLAMDDIEGDEIASQLARSPRFVYEWAARYRKGGLDALRPRKQSGRPPKLTAEQTEQLRRRLDAGPRAGDGGVCTLRGKDVCRIIEREFNVVHTLGGIYDVLRRIGYCSLVPRPRHRKSDPATVAQFQADAPLFSGE